MVTCPRLLCAFIPLLARLSSGGQPRNSKSKNKTDYLVVGARRKEREHSRGRQFTLPEELQTTFPCGTMTSSTRHRRHLTRARCFPRFSPADSGSTRYRRTP